MKKLHTVQILFVLAILTSCSEEKKVNKPEIVSENEIIATTPSDSSMVVSDTAKQTPVSANLFGTASLSGKVKFEGDLPKPKAINMSADKLCMQQHKDNIFQEDAVISTNGEMKWVFVYIKEGIKQKYPVPQEPVTLDQKGCQYHPHVFGIIAGQLLQIKNSDPLLHNVHTSPSLNQEFNKGQPKQGMIDVFTFDKPEIMLPFKCDVHPWMSAKASIVEHPFFAVTGKDGSYTINNLPAGKYTLAAVSEKYGEKTLQVTVTDGGTQTANFEFSK